MLISSQINNQPFGVQLEYMREYAENNWPNSSLCKLDKTIVVTDAVGKQWKRYIKFVKYEKQIMMLNKLGQLHQTALNTELLNATIKNTDGIYVCMDEQSFYAQLSWIHEMPKDRYLGIIQQQSCWRMTAKSVMSFVNDRLIPTAQLLDTKFKEVLKIVNTQTGTTLLGL